MAVYYYAGKRTDGRKISGFMAAASDRELNKIMYGQCVRTDKTLKLLELGGLEYSLIKPKELTKVSKKQMADFFEQLYFALDAGLSMAESIEIVSKSSTLSTAMLGMKLKRYISSGIALDEALNQSRLFPKDVIIKVRAGAESATMNKTLKGIVDKLRQELELSSKIKSAMMYPMMMFLVMIVIAFVLLTFIVPTIGDVIGEIGGELPAVTQAVLNFSEVVQSYWWLILAVMFLSVTAVIKLYRGKGKFRSAFDSIVYKIPVIGQIVYLNDLFTFNSNFHQLLESGVEQDRALNILNEVINNVLMQKAVKEIAKDISEQGFDIYTAMSKQTIMPSDYLQFIMVGVNTGNLVDILASVSKKYKHDIESRLERATKLVEPIAIIIIGIMIGGFVISMWLPLFSITDMI